MMQGMSRLSNRRSRDAVKRAAYQSERAGTAIAAARAEHGWSRAEMSRRAGVSPDTARRVEHGEPGIHVDTLCAVGEAVGLDIVIQTYDGRPPSLRDTGQLLVAEHLRSLAHAVWSVQFELLAGEHGEAADAGFFGPIEIIDTEIDRRLLDFQRQYRRNARKRDWIAALHQRPVRLVMVVEDTEYNRLAVQPHAAFIASVLPAGSREVLRSLRSGLPLGRDGLLWIRRRRLPRR